MMVGSDELYPSVLGMAISSISDLAICMKLGRGYMFSSVFSDDGENSGEHNENDKHCDSAKHFDIDINCDNDNKVWGVRRFHS